MPFYEFYCDDCGIEFEEHFDVDENRENVCCPECGGRNVRRDYSEVAFGIHGGCKPSKKEEKDKGCGFIKHG